MSSTSTIFDFSVPLATWLADTYDDATYADVFQALKYDRVGYEAAASQLVAGAGQLWSNGVDDFILYVYAHNPGRKDYTLSTSGATTDSQLLATLDTNGQLWRIEGIVTGRTATQGEVVSCKIGGHYYRAAGSVSTLDLTHTVARATLASADADIVVTGDNVSVVCTGEAAKDITWHVRITMAEQIS